jgi:hypothetical protein
MGGAMLQLVAYGAQDVYLTGTPQITFFRSVYKRYSHFASEYYKNLVTESIANSSTLRIKLARVGDLVSDMFFELPVLPSVLGNMATDGSSADLVYVAERAFESIELQIGNTTIDKHYQTWWRLYAELFSSSSRQAAYSKLVTNAAPVSTVAQTCFLPLVFFFNRSPGLALPLCALQYHDVTLICTLSSTYSTYFNTSIKPILWTNYITLDKEERRRFTQSPHEYLIEQVQYSGDTVPAQKLKVVLRHPVKELIWCYPIPSGVNALWNFTSNTNVQLSLSASNGIHDTLVPTLVPPAKWVEDGPVTSAYAVGPLNSMTLYFNGQERFQHTGKFLNQVQPYTYHTGAPCPGVYSYSFAIKPEDPQPSGTCNFSRIDNTEFVISLKSGAPNVKQMLFAVNYNILRIQSGLGGLAFA